MKIIESYGGPLIGLSRCDVQHWSGIEGKLFIGDASPFSNDYDAIKSAMLDDNKLSGYLAKMTGVTDEGLLINTPVRTLVVASPTIALPTSHRSSHPRLIGPRQ